MIDSQARLLQLKERVMPKLLSDDAVQQFHRDGFCPPIQVLSSAEVAVWVTTLSLTTAL